MNFSGHSVKFVFQKFNVIATDVLDGIFVSLHTLCLFVYLWYSIPHATEDLVNWYKVTPCATLTQYARGMLLSSVFSFFSPFVTAVVCVCIFEIFTVNIILLSLDLFIFLFYDFLYNFQRIFVF